ncbi:zinc carboxypeptidase A [Xylariaceae sp. FL0662B]|nr:zinc carboxypeptidase A [Xylariaceae sp. FL0662B]
MKFSSLACSVAVLGAAVQTSRRGKTTFDGYKVYRVTTNDLTSDFKSEIEALSAIELHHDQRRRGSATFDIAIPSEGLVAFDLLNVTAEVLSEDLGTDIAAEGTFGDYPELDENGIPSLSWFESYHAYEDHIRLWSDFQAAFDQNSELIQAGVSFEGRDIQGIHLWGSGGKNSKPAIFFNGNVHAREWITSMVVEYLIYQLVTGYENDTIVQSALDNYDFYILPVVNPDGFVYSQTDNRLWRKNRQTRENTTAVGTDINRNWSVGFGGDGSSSEPDSETFSGYQPGDTPECAALMDFAQGLAADKGIKLYIDWHSYAQVILLSYGWYVYTCDEFPSNIEEQISLAAGTAGSIAQPYNTTFDYGPGCIILYQSSGNGRDYMTDAAGAEFGWGIELRSTSYGFILPPDQIFPSSIEVWEGMKYLWSNL